MFNENIELYTDGCALGNPGKAGYGYVIVYPNGTEYKKNKGFEISTNNRMELMAVIDGLKALKYPSNVNIYSDSNYVVKAINSKWLDSWKNNGWKNTKRQQVANIDLWKDLDKEIKRHKSLTFIWVKGHAGNRYNEVCDMLANSAARWSYEKLEKDINFDGN